MTTMRGTRVPVGSASWVNEERTTALSIVQAEAEEFSFAAKNEFDWLNEHMAGIFNENEMHTPGKLRSKTPRTTRKVENGEPRVPLSDVFSSTPNGALNSFTQQLARTTPKGNPAQSTSSPMINRNISPHKAAPSPRPVSKPPIALADSGYYGSQDVDNVNDNDEDDMDVDLIEEETQLGEPRSSPPKTGRVGHVAFDTAAEQSALQSPTVTRTIRSPEVTFQTAKEDQTTRMMRDITEEAPSPVSESSSAPQSSPKRAQTPSSPAASPRPRSAKASSPMKTSLPIKRSPAKVPPPPSPSPMGSPSPAPEPTPVADSQDEVDVHMDDDTRSPSDESSPIRPVRKSSLNFASLPAREPLRNKSIGPRVSRTSHLDTNRQSHYSRQTGGKSLGNNLDLLGASDDEEGNEDEMKTDDSTEATNGTDNYASKHNKTYTQRLQDQINLLGKSQTNASRPSKSIPGSAVAHQTSHTSAHQSAAEAKAASPVKKSAAPPTPGAFPEDDEDEGEEEEEEEDDWIAPPVPAKDTPKSSPRPQLPKNHTADVMEGIEGADTVSGSEFALPKQWQSPSRSSSPNRAPVIPERTTSVFSHGKSASVSVLPDMSKDKMAQDLSLAKKHVSVSNPLFAVPENRRPETPQSPTRSFRDSPLKQVKNKLSSILKSSKGLLASSAAVSAEGKSSLMSPSTARFGLHSGPSTDSIAPHQSAPVEPLYPDLSKRIAPDVQTLSSVGSPEKPVARRTRASVEKEKEDKLKEKEAKLMADQMSKLDKARAEEREKARTFSKEQEKIAAMEKKIAAQRETESEKGEEEKEVERPARTPAPKEAPRPIRTSPRKAKNQAEAEASQPGKLDVEMTEAPTPLPPPSAPRSVGPSQTARPRELRRPMKPMKEAPSKVKQAPTVIRVNTGSQHSQYHPSTSTLSSGLQDTLGSSVKAKASQPGSHSKQSLASLKSSVSSNGRPKALELAAKRKEQEEREAQRKKDAKLELERKRAAIQEEERKQELQRRQEADRQREREREQAEAKKNAQRQAAIERPKQTRAPPPAVRSQPNGPPDYTASQRSDGQPPRPPSRLTSTAHRSQEDQPVNAVLSNASKPGSKRPLPQEGREERSSRNPAPRNGPSYQSKEAKRRRTSDDFADELDMDIQPPNIKGPPVRPPSVGYKKQEMPTKSMFGYNNAPPSASRDLFKSTVTAQHHSTIKSAKQVDMNQFAQGQIPFAPNPNPAGPAHKTPARPMGATSTKSAAKATRSSPRFQDGEKIELPEIDTDEDEDEGDSHFGVAPWADSPDLRRALMRQETMNPEGIFGPPRALNMEEVFSNKERWHKFRARTSSANWSGSDRLTEDEIRKDLAARDKLRREGGWSYEMSKDLI
ncbi:Inner centromere protein-related protein pic1 [Colletotrichum shisoi]|uniref:Inner centromere protein-related protein pic1 n=1 Tax=Colletotrichum shisoi TaxID=2078593 RepID=A0A5Q4BK32_9PEZI|nr:Inner centromere protein-related protein pic1 [Colletotrichum shisoi]